jgi:hypothetical protein
VPAERVRRRRDRLDESLMPFHERLAIPPEQERQRVLAAMKSTVEVIRYVVVREVTE